MGSEMESRIEKFFNKYIDIIFIILIVAIALFARLAVFKFESHDYNAFLSNWFDTLKNDGFSAFKEGFSDYPPLYLYFFWLLTFLPFDKLFLIKALSVAFDFLIAYNVMRIVGLRYSSRAVRYSAFAAVLLLPTVLLNGAVWGQCDVIYTAFLIGCLFQYLNKKPAKAMLYFSIAFSFKLQSIFLAPLLVFLLIKGIAKLKHFLMIPIVYIVLAIPVLIAGRSFAEVLVIYFNQYDSYHFLTLACPNFYHWINSADPQSFSTAGIMLTGAVVLILLYAGWYLTRGKPVIDMNALISAALVSTLVLPYFLPRMHERYFFPADIISLIWAYLKPERAWLAVIISIVSLFSYAPYLFGTEPVSQSILAIVMLAVIVIVIRKTYEDFAAVSSSELL